MDLRIYKFDLKILEELTLELLTIDRYYNLGIINRSSRGGIELFNHDFIHKSNPVKKGQITLQLRYWSPNNLSLRKDIINSLSVTTQKTIDSVTKACQEIENLI